MKRGKNMEGMKSVIFKEDGCFYITPDYNFYREKRNTRLLLKRDNFESAQEIIDYYCKWFDSDENNFIVDESCSKRG